jgi:allophanate hydrolase subunit 2
MIGIESWGIAGAVVDAGRVGRAWLGASRGGAVDLASHALVNRILGNDERAGTFETSGGLTVVARESVLVAWTGAVADIVVEDGPPLGWGAHVMLPAGAVLRVGRLHDGARGYLGVRGGVDAHGTVGTRVAGPPATEVVPRHERTATVRMWPGPRLDWFREGSWDALSGARTVIATNRVGTRFDGAALVRRRHDELPSEGLVEGAVQVPPDGNPIVMLADHPTTGGYPVIAVVDPADIAAVAQAAPGTTLRFVAAR